MKQLRQTRLGRKFQMVFSFLYVINLCEPGPNSSFDTRPYRSGLRRHRRNSLQRVSGYELSDLEKARMLIEGLESDAFFHLPSNRIKSWDHRNEDAINSSGKETIVLSKRKWVDVLSHKMSIEVREMLR